MAAIFCRNDRAAPWRELALLAGLLRLARELDQLGVPHGLIKKVLGWPNICQLAHAFLWECGDKRLKLAQHLGQLGVFLTLVGRAQSTSSLGQT